MQIIKEGGIESITFNFFLAWLALWLHQGPLRTCGVPVLAETKGVHVTWAVTSWVPFTCPEGWSHLPGAGAAQRVNPCHLLLELMETLSEILLLSLGRR